MDVGVSDSEVNYRFLAGVQDESHQRWGLIRSIGTIDKNMSRQIKDNMNLNEIMPYYQ